MLIPFWKKIEGVNKTIRLIVRFIIYKKIYISKFYYL